MKREEDLLFICAEAITDKCHLPTALLRANCRIDQNLEVLTVAPIDVVAVPIQPMQCEWDVSVSAH